MIIGQTLVAGIDNSTVTDTIVYTPWFPRRGNNVTSSCQVIAISGTEAEVQVDMLEKDSEDTGGGAPKTAAGTSSSQAATTFSFRCTDCKELVRYRITLTSDSKDESGTLYAHFRMLPPSWETTGVQGV